MSEEDCGRLRTLAENKMGVVDHPSINPACSHSPFTLPLNPVLNRPPPAKPSHLAQCAVQLRQLLRVWARQHTQTYVDLLYQRKSESAL